MTINKGETMSGQTADGVTKGGRRWRGWIVRRGYHLVQRVVVDGIPDSGFGCQISNSPARPSTLSWRRRVERMQADADLQEAYHLAREGAA